MPHDRGTSVFRHDPERERDRTSRRDSLEPKDERAGSSSSREQRHHHREHHQSHRSDRHRSERSRRGDRSISRSRSRSPKRHRDSDRDRDRNGDRDRGSSRRSTSKRDRDHRSESEASEEDVVLPRGAQPIGLDDFFIKATELKLWLWEEKGKKLDSLKNEDARRYFKKFCRAWNKGRLSDNFYVGISPASLPSSISTSHSWSFLSKTSNQRDLDAAATVRRSIDTGTKERSYESSTTVASRGHPAPSSSSLTSQRVVGPTLPPGPPLPPSSAVEQLQLERDELDRERQRERNVRDVDRKRSNREERDAERDARATGRDRVLEKRRIGNQSRREFEQSREAGGMVEVPDEVLMGGSGGGSGVGGGFQEALRERERARERREGRKHGFMEEKQAVISDKLSAFRQKEDATMAQFRALAAERFGPKPPQ